MKLLTIRIRIRWSSVRSLFGGKTRDFITAVDEKNIIVVKELFAGEGYAEMEKVAEEMLVYVKYRKAKQGAHIAYGTIVNDIKEVSRSYKEAKLALDVGKIFFEETEISSPTVRLASDG